MPRPVPADFNREDFSDSDWYEMGMDLEMNGLPARIDRSAADAIWDFKNNLDVFFEPLRVFDVFGEVQYQMDFKELDFVSEWFAKQLEEGKPQAELDHLYGLYRGWLLHRRYEAVGAGWTLDPRPNSVTYLKPVIGPFACEKPMRYIDPFEYAKENWIDALPEEIFYLVRTVSDWFEQSIDDLKSSPLETHFFRKMNDIHPEFDRSSDAA